MSRTVRRGVTLLELMVALAILAIALAIVPLAPVRLESVRTDPLIELRRRAIRTGLPTTAILHEGDSAFVATALPDGRLIGKARARRVALTGTRR